MLDRSPEDSMQDIDKRCMIWGMFMSSTLDNLLSWERITQTIYIPSEIQGKNLTLKKMFEISEQLKLEQSDEIYGVSQISWESSPWKQLCLVNDEEVISLSHATVDVFSDSVLCLGKVNQNRTSKYCLGRTVEYRTLDTIDGEPMEFEWNVFSGLTTLQRHHMVNYRQ